MKYDYLIIGAGLFGSIFAYEANKLGKSVLVIDKRSHIGGNCYTEKYEDYHIHKYGAHIFHTSKKHIWDYVNQFTTFRFYSHRVKSFYQNKLYSMPINLITLNQIWPDVKTPEQAKKRINSEKLYIPEPQNLEEQILSQVGPTLYEMFIKGYTTKQWGRSPADLPSYIIKRLPIRYNMNERYYHDTDLYEGLPINGYTELFENLLKGIKVELNVDFNSDRNYWNQKSNKIVYTGQIQQYFDHMFGNLEYRSLRFENKEIDNSDFQGTSVVNYPSLEESYTRIIQHRYFNLSESKKDFITYEYPENYDSKSSEDPYYPVNTLENIDIYEKYLYFANKYCPYLILGGRLGLYKYLDMDKTIELALEAVNKEFAGI